MQSLSYSYYLASIYDGKSRVSHTMLKFRTTLRDKQNLGNLQEDPLMEKLLEPIHPKGGGESSHWQYLKTEKQRTLQNWRVTPQKKNPEIVHSLHQVPKKKDCFGSFYGEVCSPLLHWAESMFMKTQTMSSEPSGHPTAGVVVGTAGMIELVTLEEKLHPKWYY